MSHLVGEKALLGRRRPGRLGDLFQAHKRGFPRPCLAQAQAQALRISTELRILTQTVKSTPDPSGFIRRRNQIKRDKVERPIYHQINEDKCMQVVGEKATILN